MPFYPALVGQKSSACNPLDQFADPVDDNKAYCAPPLASLTDDERDVSDDDVPKKLSQEKRTQFKTVAAATEARRGKGIPLEEEGPRGLTDPRPGMAEPDWELEAGGKDFTKKYNAWRGDTVIHQHLNAQRDYAHGSIYDTVQGHRISNKVTGDLKGLFRKEAAESARYKDKSDRSTHDMVLDPRTLMILYKMRNVGTFRSFYGTISTGKEAAVFHAIAADSENNDRPKHLAIKIYRTSILGFRDRDRYVSGEYRFQAGYSKRNMVRLWAEKEYRNYKRLEASGIPGPAALLLKGNVLVMSLIGSDSGIAAPRLKDADIDDYDPIYVEVVLLMVKLYQKCRLVHADLSEYNMLYHNDTVHIIDVSQSVENDHPRALDFLRMDCYNVTSYFRRMHVKNLCSIRDLFDIIRDRSESDPASRLERTRSERPASEKDEDDRVFRQTFLPTSLHQIAAGDEDYVCQQGEEMQTFCDLLAPGPACGDATLETPGSPVEEEDGSEGDGEEGEEAPRPWQKHDKQARLRKNQDKEERRAHQKQVKSETREKRMNKNMSNREKKRRVKKTARK